MPDNPGKKRPMDSRKVNIHEDYEVNYWCERFHCSREELVDAVNMVGTSVTAVEEYFNK